MAQPIHRRRTGVVLGAAVAALLAAAGLPAQTHPPLRLVSTAWPPFTSAPGQPRFALDLVEEALQRIGIAARTTIVEPADFTTALLTGRFDGSAAAWKDTAREKVLLFSRPYLENRLMLVGRRGSDVSATSLGALSGKRVAIVEGYAYGEGTELSGATFVPAAREEDALKLLLAGSVDYALMDDLVVQYILTNYAEEARTRLAIGSTPVLVRPLYLALRRDLPGAQAIIDRFNQQLAGMVADRTYHRLLGVDWIQADVDGDGQAEYVPRSDRTGPNQPTLSYILPSDGRPAARPLNPDGRFLIGGSVYDGWTAVPDRFKVSDPDRPDPNKAMLGIFRFVW